MIGIYIIENIIDGKVYIGQSREILRRWGHHQRELKRGKHLNSYLQRSYDKYGAGAFTYRVLEECDAEALNEREIYWLTLYGGYNTAMTYNLMAGGQYRALSEEARQRLSEHNKGKVRTPEQRKHYSEGRKGIKFSEEHCKNISKSKTNTHYTKGYKKIEKDGVLRKVKPEDLEEYLNNGWQLSHKMFNDDYVKVVWNKGLKGIHNSPATEFKKGMKLSEETKRKMSEARKGNIRVNNGQVEKIIKPDELQKYLDMGYVKGSKPRKKVG